MGDDPRLRLEEEAAAAAERAAREVERGGADVRTAVRREIRRALHVDPREITHGERTLGQRAADIVTQRSGWWPAILFYLGFTAVYLVANHWLLYFDATLQYYTFAVSVLAILLAQVILLSQNRAAEVETALAHNSYGQVAEIFELQEQQMEILRTLDALMKDVHTLMRANGVEPRE